MKKQVQFKYPIRGCGRPQIVLIGNGLERKSGQVAWSTLVDNLTAPNSIPFTDEEKEFIPFPLLYEAIILNRPIPAILNSDEIKEEEKRLKREMEKLVSLSNDLLDKLPMLNADHIFTTNYSYCLEKAFFPKRSFISSNSRSPVRFNMMSLDKNGKKKREVYYRLHSGYSAKNSNSTDVALWHIHGEVGSARGIVLGHDRYGRLLKRIIDHCSNLDYEDLNKSDKLYSYSSWPELFLFGDIYVIGFGFYQCEFDLWWLLRRKQRERYGDGRVYFYDKNITLKELIEETTETRAIVEDKNKAIQWHNHSVQENNIRNKLLAAHGVQIIDLGSSNETSYDDFYKMAFSDVRERIEKSRLVD